MSKILQVLLIVSLIAELWFSSFPRTLTISPTKLNLQVGQQAVVTATLWDEAGEPVHGMLIVYLPSEDQGNCAWVDQFGVVTAVREGECGIGALLPIGSTGVMTQVPTKVIVTATPTPTPEPIPSPTPTPKPCRGAGKKKCEHTNGE